MFLLRFTGLFLRVAGGAVVLAALGWFAACQLLHVRLLSVQTGSMQPVFAPGDGLLTRPIAPDSIQVGDIISYHSSRNPRELITHRVAALPSKSSMQTKGDALSVPDPVVRRSLAAGKVVAVLPAAGRLVNVCRSTAGLIVLVYIPVAAVAVQELRRLERSVAGTRPYHLHQTQSGIITI